MSDTNFTYGETTVLADTDDIAQVTETVQSGIEQVLADTEDLNNDHNTLDAKLDTITTELSAIKKSVSDGKTLVAGAITAKGIDTATDAEFATIASNIESIVTLDSAPGLEAQSYTPGTSNIVIGAGNYLRGDQTIVGDSNLVAGNIAKGKSIFGVTGTYAPGAFANISNIGSSISLSSSTTYSISSAPKILFFRLWTTAQYLLLDVSTLKVVYTSGMNFTKGTSTAISSGSTISLNTQYYFEYNGYYNNFTLLNAVCTSIKSAGPSNSAYAVHVHSIY